MLAPAVQRLKSTFYGLHHRCKSQKVVFAICTTGATAQKQFFPFAPMVQETKSSFFCLHHRCKRQKEVFEVCTAGASVPKNTLTVTARYPRHSSGIRNLILSSNSRKYKQTRVKRGSSYAFILVELYLLLKENKSIPSKRNTLTI